MSDREIARALTLLTRWRMFVGAVDPTSTTFAATYRALCAETDDFLGTDKDPPRAEPSRTCGNCGRVELQSAGILCTRCGQVASPPNVNASKSTPK